MGYGASAGNSLGAVVSSTGKEKPGPGMALVFSTWPVRERLSDI